MSGYVYFIRDIHGRGPVKIGHGGPLSQTEFSGGKQEWRMKHSPHSREGPVMAVAS